MNVKPLHVQKLKPKLKNNWKSITIICRLSHPLIHKNKRFFLITDSNVISCTQQQKGPSGLMTPIFSYFRQLHCKIPDVKIPDSLKQLWLLQLWFLSKSCPRSLFLCCLKTILIQVYLLPNQIYVFFPEQALSFILNNSSPFLSKIPTRTHTEQCFP